MRYVPHVVELDELPVGKAVHGLAGQLHGDQAVAGSVDQENGALDVLDDAPHVLRVIL